MAYNMAINPEAMWMEHWQRDKFAVGKAMHEGWKRQKIINGFADHPFNYDGAAEGTHDEISELICGECPKTHQWHHADMIPWHSLPEHQQAINYEGGREGYRMGFDAGRRVARADG